MRLVAAAFAICALALPSGTLAQQSPGWTYAYVDGVATATQRDDRGRTTATLTCRPPEGDIVLTDHTFGRNARRVTTAAVALGNLTINVPATSEGRGRNARVLVNLPQRPPILAGAQESDRLSITVNGQTNTYLAGSATKMREVAYACWGS